MTFIALSIAVTPDPEPLLLVFGADIKTEETRLEIYDARTGEYLREMKEPGQPLSFRPLPRNAAPQEETP